MTTIQATGTPPRSGAHGEPIRTPPPNAGITSADWAGVGPETVGDSAAGPRRSGHEDDPVAIGRSAGTVITAQGDRAAATALGRDDQATMETRPTDNAR
jgi:hypothetical protein